MANLNNKCLICGAPCKSKYCKGCAKKAYIQKTKENRLKKSARFMGCNEDCFNCPYPDCRKPAHKMKTDKALTEALAVI